MIQIQTKKINSPTTLQIILIFILLISIFSLVIYRNNLGEKATINVISTSSWSCQPSTDSRDGSGSVSITKINGNNPANVTVKVGERINIEFTYITGQQGVGKNGAILLFTPASSSANLVASVLKPDSQEVERNLNITQPSQNNPLWVLNNYQCQINRTCIRTGDGIFNPGQLESRLFRIGIPETGLGENRKVLITLTYTTPIIAQYETIKGKDQKYAFLFAVDGDGDGIGSYTSFEKTPRLAVLPQSAYFLQWDLPSNTKINMPTKLTVKARDKYGNLATDYRGTVNFQERGSSTLDGLPTTYSFTESDKGSHTFNLLPKTPGTIDISSSDSENKLLQAEENTSLVDNSSNQIYWGDIHVHSYQSDGVYSLYKLYDAAQNIASLDFSAASDHSHWLSGNEWKSENDAASLFNNPGEFVTFPGYEMSFGTDNGGDINAYFNSDNGPVLYPTNRHFYTVDGVNPCETKIGFGVNNAQEALFNNNLTNLLPNDVIAIPHHLSWDAGGTAWQYPPFDPLKLPEISPTPKYNYFNPDLEKVVEIYSEQGSGEYFDNPLRHGQEAGQSYSPPHTDNRYACRCPQSDPNLPCQGTNPVCPVPTNIMNAQIGLARGFKFGFIGSSDDHWNTFPGGVRPSRTTPSVEGTTKTNCDSSLCYKGGFAAVIAPSLTRSDLFSAIRNRHTYATTGEKIYLNFEAKVDGKNYLMGDEITTSSAPIFSGTVYGTTELESVEVVKGKTGSYDPRQPFETAYQAPLNGKTSSFTFTPKVENAFYYLRVTEKSSVLDDPSRPNMAWSSPIWVDIQNKQMIQEVPKNKPANTTSLITPIFKGWSYFENQSGEKNQYQITGNTLHVKYEFSGNNDSKTNVLTRCLIHEVVLDNQGKDVNITKWDTMREDTTARNPQAGDLTGIKECWIDNLNMAKGKKYIIVPAMSAYLESNPDYKASITGRTILEGAVPPILGAPRTYCTDCRLEITIP